MQSFADCWPVVSAVPILLADVYGGQTNGETHS